MKSLLMVFDVTWGGEDRGVEGDGVRHTRCPYEIKTKTEICGKATREKKLNAKKYHV